MNEPTLEDSVKILRGLKANYEKHHKVRYTDEAIRAAVELSAKYINDRKLPDKAIDVIDEVGAIAHAAARAQAPEDRHAARRRGDRRQDRPHSSEERVGRRQGDAAQSGARPEVDGVRPGQGDRGAVGGDQAGPRRPARAGEADRQLPVLRPDRRRQDRGRAAAGRHHGHRADPLRHVGIHGAAFGVAADRRAAGLCRLRPGRAADRRDRPASARGAAAGRDREGASGPVQHPAAGDGPREADRPQRQDGRFPQRDPDHDDQRRRVRPGEGGHRLRPRHPRRARTRTRSSACSRRSSATGWTRRSPSPA